jgi:hypothetical protein
LRLFLLFLSLALPGREMPAFLESKNNIHRIIDGENFISSIPDDVKDNMLQKNVTILKKGKSGKQEKIRIQSHQENINLCASIGDSFDLTRYGIPANICATMDRAVQVSVAAGLEALKDAGIVSGIGEGTKGWELPEHLQPTTGVVYATSFPALDTAISEVTRYFRSQDVNSGQIQHILQVLRDRLQSQLGGSSLPSDSEDALKNLAELAEAAAASNTPISPEETYEFDRKFLFRVLVLGNAQLAQIVKARGPNMQTNAACAGEQAMDNINMNPCFMLLPSPLLSLDISIYRIDAGYRYCSRYDPIGSSGENDCDCG